MASSAGFSLACAAAAWAMKFILMKKNKTISRTSNEAILYYAY
jgi:hypothetical protein